MNERRILIAGVGNELLADDGLGVHALRALHADPRLPSTHRLRLVEVGTAVLDALEDIDWAEHILILDAVHAGGPPGTCYLVRGELAPGDARHGLHVLSIAGALTLLGPHHPSPSLSLIGAEPERIEYGMQLSPTLESALPAILDHLLTHISDLLARRLPGVS